MNRISASLALIKRPRLCRLAAPRAASCLPQLQCYFPQRCMSVSPKKKSERLNARAAVGDAPASSRLTVALVGRPNVGKSSLFNYLVGRRLAIVNSTPGTTRDWKEAEGRIGNLTFAVMDTGGLEDSTSPDAIESKMLAHTAAALAHADVLLFMLDGGTGLTDSDVRFARWLKQLRSEHGYAPNSIHPIVTKADRLSLLSPGSLPIESPEPAPAPAPAVSGVDDSAGAGTLTRRQRRQAAGLTVDRSQASPAAPSGGGSERTSSWSRIAGEALELGLGEPTAVSVASGLGMSDLHNILYAAAVARGAVGGETGGLSLLSRPRETPAEVSGDDTSDTAAALDATAETVATDGRADGGSGKSSSSGSSSPSESSSGVGGRIQLAIVGRPNVGKSSVVNCMLGSDRVLTGPQSGLTRDPTTVALTMSSREVAAARAAAAPALLSSPSGPSGSGGGGGGGVRFGTAMVGPVVVPHGSGEFAVDSGAAQSTVSSAAASSGATAGAAGKGADKGGGGGGIEVQLVDTAGMRRWGAWDLTTTLEGESVGAAKRVLQRAHVVALVCDASGGTADSLPSASEIQRAAAAVASGGGGSGPGGRRSASSPHPPAAAVVRSSRRVAGAGLSQQDMTIAEDVLAQGKGLVIVLNKLDTLLPPHVRHAAAAAAAAATAAAAGEGGAAGASASAAAGRALLAAPGVQRVVDFVRAQLDSMHACQGAEVVPVSALLCGGGAGAHAILPAVLRTHDRWALRVPTATLNRWLELIQRHHPPPSANVTVASARPRGRGDGRRPVRQIATKLKFMSQTGVRPPTFTIFANRAALPETYQRYLVNALRREFQLFGVPLRLHVKAADNPYKPSALKAAAAAKTAAWAPRRRPVGATHRKDAAPETKTVPRTAPPALGSVKRRRQLVAPKNARVRTPLGGASSGRVRPTRKRKAPSRKVKRSRAKQ